MQATSNDNHFVSRLAKFIITLAAACAAGFGGMLLWHHFVSRKAESVKVTGPGDDLYSPISKIFKRGRRDLPEVCLTFDDGPHPQSLPDILRILKENDVKASFFMVGRRIQEHPDLARLVLKEGHEVGNHTQNHLRLDELPADQIRMEVALCESAFEQATGGVKMHLFRPPGMRFTPDVLKIAREFDYTTVGWNYGGKDFQVVRDGPSLADHPKIAEYVLDNVTSGGIILLHDNPDTAKALPEILRGLKARGFAIKNVTEMMAGLPEPIYLQSNAGKTGRVAAVAH